MNFQTIKNSLGELLFDAVGLFREEKKLILAQDTLKGYQDDLKNMGITDKSKVYNTELKEFMEFKHMIFLSSIIVKSALNRKESRGAHFRSDFLETDKMYEKSSIVTKYKNTLMVKI